jgi:hypothetical protein
MKLYTISELEQLTTEEINDILQSRGLGGVNNINYYIKIKKKNTQNIHNLDTKN